MQRNLEFKEIWVQNIWLKTELTFKKFAQRFLIKTNFDNILSPKRFGSKEVGLKNESKQIWSKEKRPEKTIRSKKGI